MERVERIWKSVAIIFSIGFCVVLLMLYAALTSEGLRKSSEAKAEEGIDTNDVDGKCVTLNFSGDSRAEWKICTYKELTCITRSIGISSTLHCY